jgi:type I restriction enzyme, R subunit
MSKLASRTPNPNGHRGLAALGDGRPNRMNASVQPKSANFNFLSKRYPDLERIGALCERYFSDDPIVALITLRQFGELLAQMVGARSGLLTDPREQQADLLRRLRVEANYPRNVLDLFHQIRVDGNAATHRRDGDHAKALACRKMARQLGIWFYLLVAHVRWAVAA